MWLFDEYGIDVGYVVMGMAGIILIMFIMLIVTMAKNSSMRKKYKVFMDGENGKNLEKAILDKFSAIDNLESNVEDIYRQIKAINGQLVTAYQKIGLVKYDAFKEIGGKLSFVLVLLTAENNGFIMNSMHSSKEGCYTYAKEVVNGEAFVILSEEEQQALEEAKSNISLKKLAEGR
ncbi:MAG: DUF4446 family protein [Lachnospiraceae bacterium]|jgi:hypothetical protein|nr:DUF4446 family protein [Lachnospiraceae bacterium]MCX4374996.1 DUF4446 family protein [Lachnospiraceae bacterium]RKI30592.1 DUF4446 family protein [bacterium D16-36]RKI72103.1 DUF4446 family protein [bacterium 1xD8-6]